MADNDNVKSDYEYSRDTYYEILEKGKDALELMIEVARESEHPRAFEVLSNMMKQMSEINEKLTDLNRKQKELKKELPEDNRKITNNNLFIGSTVDLQRLLNQKPEESVVTIEQTPE